VREFWPDITLGGAYYSPGHLAMTLSDNWLDLRDRMKHVHEMALYYVGVKGTGRGWVRPSTLGHESTLIRYHVSDLDCRNLSVGLARISAILLAAGAVEVCPSVHGLPSIRTEIESVRWLDESLPKAALGLTTVHAFSSCPAGQRQDRCAADSWGRVFGFMNLFINDASMLPDSPGVNPQGAVMALARRNALRFAAA
jgi:choline dehydrogenase-like flavoprotein